MSSNLQLHVGGQLMDSVAPKDTPGTDDEGERGPRTKNRQACGGRTHMLIGKRRTC